MWTQLPHFAIIASKRAQRGLWHKYTLVTAQFSGYFEMYYKNVKKME